jgi:lysine/ornithine N-monooxygenase
MNETTAVAIIGAGPYGLSLAAHLRAAGVGFRIFGRPMHAWRHHMPRGMLLKSPGFAANLADPRQAFTLKAYCASRGIPYDDVSLPVSLSTFADYGIEFQQRLVPDLEERQVVSIEPRERGFLLRFSEGDTCHADKVVVAVGIGHFQQVPAILRGLPGERVTHSGRHADYGGFRGRDVTVVGGGASAVDAAASLLEAGATVRIIARAAEIKHAGPPVAQEPWWRDQLRGPQSGLGRGWRNKLCTDAPLLFRLMPEDFRLRVVRTHLGPFATWREWAAIDGRVPMLTGTRIGAAGISDGRVRLGLVRDGGVESVVTTDHVIAATGYRVDLRQLPFLGEPLRAAIRSLEHTPELSSHFESSVAGLYFVGPASANTFGPMLRFACGAGFASRRLSRHLRQAR